MSDDIDARIKAYRAEHGIPDLDPDDLTTHDETHRMSADALASFVTLPKPSGLIEFTTAGHVAYDSRTRNDMSGYAEPIAERVEHGEIIGGPLDGLRVTLVEPA